MEVLFKTVHGSHLYGLAHENSDNDFYTVVSKVKTARAKYARQSIVDGVDSTMVDFGTWLMQCEAGVPQALEAMFSTMPLVDNLEGFRLGYRTGTQCWDRYLRTIKSFAMNDEEDETFHLKKKRHALRLALNFNDMRRYGMFNPTLTNPQKVWLNDYAGLPSESLYRLALHTAWKS